MVSSPCLSPIGAKLTPYYNNKSVNGRMELVILSQPEEQHRARYLTEGSRGAIKDITGMGHPVVKLNGYYSRQPIKLECYIGHDKHNGLPHLFYQASKISGKNSTQCTACKVEGTSVIVMNLLPEHGMQATIDCVGILKERNVDVEQKLLNLNHSNKMIDFNDHSYQSAFTSLTSSGQQQQQQQQLQTQQHQQIHNNQQQQQLHNHHLHNQNNNNHHHHHHLQTTNNNNNHHHQPQLLNANSDNHVNHSMSPFKFERRETLSISSSHIDENSIGAMSRTDSLEDSNDLISAARNATVCDRSINIVNDSNGCSNGKGIIQADNSNQALLQNNHGTTNLLALNSRKRSVRCRLVFRVKIPETGEVLQTISTPIICTQPLGTPEICKKSITRAPIVASNGLELFIIGKNFLKDSKIVFRNKKNDWMKVVEPDKEFLNSSHLVCKVPDYDGPDLNERPANDIIEVELQVRSGGKFSESHSFIYFRTATSNGQPEQQQSVFHLVNGQVKFETHSPPQQVQQQQQQQSSPAQQTPPQLSPIQEQTVQLHDQHQQQQQHVIQEQQQIQQQQQYQSEPPPQQQQFEQQQQQLVIQEQQQQHVLQEQQQLQRQLVLQQQQQQQQQQHVIQEQQQIQQQLVIQQQQQQQQQQIQTSQILTSIDLNDETTIIYGDAFQSQPLVHNVLQTGPIISNMSQIEPTLDQMNQIEPSINQINQMEPTINQISQIEQTTIDQMSQIEPTIDQMATTQTIQVLKPQQQQQYQTKQFLYNFYNNNY